ncbi:galactomannan galactosyltransferase 1-like [Thalictrum thalictroides]|uniref:Galactomannan galactosyltransferase 1-like n=1 Tax=Thalictrum thalictroides TaxID=46969 RepID=A0A7J6V8I4_THATH|nr:galactomannan galactosyltransferase 1-like [Thalictrum thalictroides]
MVALLLFWVFWSFFNPIPTTTQTSNLSSFPQSQSQSRQEPNNPQFISPTANLRHDPINPTFYDDPNLSYSIEHKIKNWDQKRNRWLSLHPSFATGVQERIFLVTGSQPNACRNPIGDNFLLRFFKNKVDYCRIHGYDIFYNNALFHPKMSTFWAKLPLVRSAMIAHPEAEWIWWVDSDAAFTDMDFKLPLDRYRNHNLVVHGWAHLVYEKKSWVSLNAGIFLIRNCQWSMDFMDVWASMGPQTPDYDMWSKIQKATLPDKLFPQADDQSALVYLLLKEKNKWADKIYLESEFYFEGYWEEIVGVLDNTTAKYREIEKNVGKLRRRHAEKVSECYSELREAYLKEAGFGLGSWRRPFITHFTGCQPCSGNHNQLYSAEDCKNGMEKVLNFADNQVLRNYGLVRRDLLDSKSLSPLPLPFDSPA